jgi:hypothetical protein
VAHCSIDPLPPSGTF